MTDQQTDLLARPAAQSVRLIAQGYLDAATRALERLDDPEDTQALHDFRVALRRLRTTLRAYRPLLEDSVRRKPRKLLKDIAAATNRVRDAEVALEWLTPLITGLTPGERVGLKWLIERIDQRRVKDQEKCLADVRRSFPLASRKLQKGLVAYRQTVGAEPSVSEASFASVVGAAALEEARQLDLLLENVRGIEDDAAHRARIAAKRLRYVLEPVKGALAGCNVMIKRLKALQDLLGELHDLQELEASLREAVGAAAAERAEQQLEAALTSVPAVGRRPRRRGKTSGLVAIGKRVRIRQIDLLAALRNEWLGHERTWEQDVAALFPGVAPAPEAVPDAVPEAVPVPVAAPNARHWAGRRPG